jgi:hypothetical protein
MSIPGVTPPTYAAAGVTENGESIALPALTLVGADGIEPPTAGVESGRKQ